MGYMGFYLFVQKIRVGNDAYELFIFVDNSNCRYFMFDKHVYQSKNRRFRMGRYKRFFHNIRCCTFGHNIHSFFIREQGTVVQGAAPF